MALTLGRVGSLPRASGLQEGAVDCVIWAINSYGNMLFIWLIIPSMQPYTSCG